MQPIFSARDHEWFTPPGQDQREYLLAPLTYRERQAFRADLAREGGIYPGNAQMIEALRQALRDSQPDNLADLLAAIDAAEAAPEDASAQAQLAAIEAACSAMPAYSSLLAARQRYLGMLPLIAARHALRDWKGPGLPEFKRVRGVVPEELLDVLPQAELESIGWQASLMMQPNQAAVGNSEAPSPSPETPAHSTAA